jgi:hypothetical protein
MIIKDINDGELKLTKTRLTEVSGGTSEPAKYYLLLKDLHANSRTVNLRLTDKNLYRYQSPHQVYVLGIFNRIGCQEFDNDTFDQILKAAHAARRKSRKKV